MTEEAFGLPWPAARRGEQRPAALEARMARQAFAVLAFSAELGSIRELLAVHGWARSGEAPL